MKYCLKAICFLTILLVVGSCQKQKTYKIGVSQCSADDWRMLMNEEIEREAMFYPEVNLEIRSADDSNEKQIADIQYFLDNDFDIIIAAPNEADALTPVIEKAYDSGVPVMLFDRNINGNSYTAFQGADNKAIGAEAAKYATKLAGKGATVLELSGLPGSTPARQRQEGFDSEGSREENALKVLATAPANWRYDDARRVTDSLLRIYPDVSLIYAHNDRMALGASDAAAKLGLHPYIIGVDAAPGIGMKGVAEGKIDATFLYPTDGHRLVRTAMSILKGEPYEREVYLPMASPVDKSNVDLLLVQNRALQEEASRMKELKREVDTYWNQHSEQTALFYSVIAILILLCVVLFLVLKTFWQHRAHRKELLEQNRLLEEQRDLEKELNRQLEEATQSKLIFFTNVSHDLRTPLTLIAEPIAQVADAPNLTDHQKVLMRLAGKNVRILKRLINQILDFRKYESDRLDFNPEEVRLGALISEWAESFVALARKRHIDYRIEDTIPEDFTVAVDVEKIERVVFNLLSNAFKFTPDKGMIGVSARILDDGRPEIVVRDNGRGISEEDIKHIFMRFYQVEKIRPEGSGIGLSLSKAFVELHNGEIKVESKIGEGAKFTIILPAAHVENRREEVGSELAAILADEIEEENMEVVVSEATSADSSKPLLLVIDDNPDIRVLVKELLKDEYNIISAPGGAEGVRMAAKYVPDLIICDVMMPGVDGLECCRRLKGEVSTSHIPVLMLTACSMDEQRVEGYQSGADGYMSKPFSNEVLRSRVDSLIENRRRIKDLFKESGLTPTERQLPEGGAEGDIENEFYARFKEIVMNEMGNPDLSVDALAERMGLGRSQFYRKIKSLTNFTPVELLRDFRLKRAHKLLISTDKSVSEIAYEVGFSTPAYFTKCYREVYSETPTAFRERMK